LAQITSSNTLQGIGFHRWPTVMLLESSNAFSSTEVCTNWAVMKFGHNHLAEAFARRCASLWDIDSMKPIRHKIQHSMQQLEVPMTSVEKHRTLLSPSKENLSAKIN
jgi:hypothetical protein